MARLFERARFTSFVPSLLEEPSMRKRIFSGAVASALPTSSSCFIPSAVRSEELMLKMMDRFMARPADDS